MPPFDPQGDVRVGYYIAGGTFVALGWGLGVIANVVLHLTAPSGGYRFYSWTVSGTLGPYAEAIVGLGLFTGAFGVVLLLLGRRAPKGRLVLPGYDYATAPGDPTRPG